MKITNVYFEQQPAHRTIGITEKLGFLEKTTEEWECNWRCNGVRRILTVPKGYVWDGASVPRIAWSIIGLTPGGLVDGPSLAHDVPYRAKGGAFIDKLVGCTITDVHGDAVRIKRDEVDLVFKYFCVFSGIRKLRAAAAYRAVWGFGRRHWGGPSPILRG